MRRLAFLFICVWTGHAQQAQLTSGGVITGMLRGDDAMAIIGGNVSLQRRPPYPPGRLRMTEWSATTGAAGSFRFDDLYGGPYHLCAQVQGSTWLNPCEWGGLSPTVSLSGTQPSASVTIILKKGVAVPIRVDDPGQLLTQNEGKTPGAHLLLGAGNDAFVFQQARVTSQDSTGRNHQIVIPFDTPVQLVVSSSFFQLSNVTTGLPLPRAGSTVIPVTVPSGQQPATVRLIVTGVGR